MHRSPKRYYIASSLDNVEQVRAVKRQLDAAGWEHTYDWTVHGSVAGQGDDVFRETSEAECRGVVLADVVVVLLHGGRGTHVELGMAIAAAFLLEGDPEPGPQVCIYSPTPDEDFGTTKKTCAFYHHPAVNRFTDLDEMVGWLLSE